VYLTTLLKLPNSLRICPIIWGKC